MVHALQEAWRVLKPDGILIDLRPAIRHCRVGVLRSGRFEELGAAREEFEGSRAANRAVARILARKIFRQTRRKVFACDVVFGSPGALREWIGAFAADQGSCALERLIQRADAARRRSRSECRLAARVTLTMKVFVKVEAPGVRRSPRTKDLAYRPPRRSSPAPATARTR